MAKYPSVKMEMESIILMEKLQINLLQNLMTKEHQHFLLRNLHEAKEFVEIKYKFNNKALKYLIRQIEHYFEPYKPQDNLKKLKI